MPNPFRIGDHVSGAFFTDRADEVHRILSALREPTRLLVFGQRRMGKSSAIRVATERARKDGVVVIRADLATASSLVDVANRLLQSLSEQRTRSRLVDLAARLAPHVSMSFDELTGNPRLSLGLERRRADDESQRESLAAVIAGLAEEARDGQRVAVVLDEFQAISRFGGETAEWHLRDQIQRHGEISFVCAGSEVSLIREMLGKERAFFRAFELLHLGQIDPEHLSLWIDDRLAGAGVAAEGVGAEIIREAGPRTQDILQVARHVYTRSITAERASPDDVDDAILDVVREEDAVLRTMWIHLTGHQQNILRAIASGTEQLFSSASRDRYGLPTSSTVATAVDALESKGLIYRDDEGIFIDSPFLRRWIEREVLSDLPPH